MINRIKIYDKLTASQNGAAALYMCAKYVHMQYNRAVGLEF